MTFSLREVKRITGNSESGFTEAPVPVEEARVLGPYAARPSWFNRVWRVDKAAVAVDPDGSCFVVVDSEAATGPLKSLTPMAFYLAFKPAERIAIKESADAMVKEFWDTYQRAERTGTMVDPNSPAVQGGLAWLAQPVTGTPPGPGIIQSSRIASILAGVMQ